MITDEMLYRSATRAHDAIAKAVNDLPEYEAPVSEQFEQQIKKLIRRAKCKKSSR